MNELPYYSVVIPLYNKEKYIKRTLESVLVQTFYDFEVVIVDDGSTDKSCEIVESIYDSRIHLIHQKNGGPSKARNRGIQEAKGKYIAFLDADDEWLSEKLEEQYDFYIENPDVMWSCSAFLAIGGKREEHIAYIKDGIIDDALDAIMDGLTIQTSSVVIKKSVFENERLFFNEAFKRSEDRELWYKLACLYPSIGYLKTELLIYYVDTLGSLNATAMGESDFSFLSLGDRISNELFTLNKKKKELFVEYLKQLTKERMLSLWGWEHSFSSISKHFEPYINPNLILWLIRLDFLPLLVKKVLVKAYLITLGKFR